MNEIKKKIINLKLKATSITVLLITVFLLAALSGTQLIKEASAISYNQYTGTLDGADWALRIPEPWNGMLVMVCRGYSGSSLPNPATTLGNVVESDILNQGFAIAASNYGATGLCIPEGVNSTYQLTMHIINNYNVSGRVFLHGMSMGGGIVLLLGEKHPEVYSGVLDSFGVKDMADLYTISKKWSNLTDEDLTTELTELNITRIPPDFFSTLEQFRNFLEMASNDTEIATGGTPETQPQAYQDISPTYHANITIPVITVHGTDDGMVPYYQSLMYQTAVADAGCSDMYRLIAVPGGGHGGLFGVSDEAKVRFNELVEWSNYLTGVYDWPMFRHDLTHNAYSESPAPNTNQTLWTSTTPVIGGQTSPAVADGKLYVGSWNGNLYCFDAANGTQLWYYTASDWLAGSPAVAEGKVYSSDVSGYVYCNDAASGVLIWNYTTGDDVRSSAAVADGKVYVGSYDGNMYCLNATTGTKIWNYTTGDRVRSSAAVADGKVYVGSYDTNVYCLDALTGVKIWNYTTGDDVRSSPAAVDGGVYIGSNDDNVYFFNATTGVKIWNYTTGGWVVSSPAVAYGKVYVGSWDDNMYCLNATTGTKIWNYTTGDNVYASPAVADGKVYAASLDNKTYCLDATTGDFIWSFTTEGSPTNPDVYSSPAVACGVVYIYSADRHIYAFGTEYVVPEGFGVEAVLLLSTVVAAVGFSLLRKRPNRKNNNKAK